MAIAASQKVSEGSFEKKGERKKVNHLRLFCYLLANYSMEQKQKSLLTIFTKSVLFMLSLWVSTQ